MSRPVVFITGAGRGVGRAIALRFAQEGYAVAAAGREEGPLHRLCTAVVDGGGRALALTCDVTRRADVAAAVAATERGLGAVDVLVNNAGLAESAPFATMSDEMWDRTLAVNLTGTYNCMRAIIPGMFERRRGRIINIASTAAKTGFAYTAAYSASKHGVLGLTRAVAVEAKSRGVTVNAICPGWLNTDMTQRSIERIVERTGRTEEEARRTIEAMNPRRRLIEPEEIADVAIYLASAAAEALTGEAIDVQ